ncbi:SDR family NAD(P)-dependent oxidoreductase, partial [Staphylococcus aureus]|nr:SDR family NAD(P)-dependent oxidoreductase [Staphylococcus aureus]
DFLEIDDAGWQETLDIDLMGAVRMCREAIPAMRAQGWGRIVLFASEDAVQPYIDELPYCAAKAGILSLAKGLSKAYGCDNVLVNTVSPAFIATPMTDKMMEKRAEEKGTSFDEAIGKIRSGLSGESEPLRDFGVFLTEAAVKAKALELGMIKVGEELTEQGKIMARAILIQEGLADANG